MKTLKDLHDKLKKDYPDLYNKYYCGEEDFININYKSNDYDVRKNKINGNFVLSKNYAEYRSIEIFELELPKIYKILKILID